MVYGEIGRFPVEIIIKLRMATFWNNMLCNNNKLSSIMYRLMFKVHQSNPIHFKLIQYGYLCGNNDVNVYATSKSSLSVKKRYFRSKDMF
jgi:hypothetical protein